MISKLIALGAGAFLLGTSCLAYATLTTIGTATYNQKEYKLIWDDDNNGKSVIWLDYSNDQPSWSDHVAWAKSLGSALTINIYKGYTVIWNDDEWRLPTIAAGQFVWGNDGITTAGYNITSSEMGHLFYEELGNLGYRDPLSRPQAGWGLTNTGDFDNLIASWYWSGTEYAVYTDLAWGFTMHYGIQDNACKDHRGYGLALRSGQVSYVPVPGNRRAGRFKAYNWACRSAGGLGSRLFDSRVGYLMK